MPKLFSELSILFGEQVSLIFSRFVYFFKKSASYFISVLGKIYNKYVKGHTVLPVGAQGLSYKDTSPNGCTVLGNVGQECTTRTK